jgi:hypothetical protein
MLPHLQKLKMVYDPIFQKTNEGKFNSQRTMDNSTIDAGEQLEWPVNKMRHREIRGPQSFSLWLSAVFGSVILCGPAFSDEEY